MRLVAGQGCGDRPHRLVGRAGRRKSTKEPGAERGSDDWIEPKLPPAACRAFQMATTLWASEALAISLGTLGGSRYGDLGAAKCLAHTLVRLRRVHVVGEARLVLKRIC